MLKPVCTFALIACAVLSSAIGVNAQEGARLSATTHKALSKIHRLIDAQKNPQALAELQGLMPTVAGNAYDAAVVQQTLGYVYNNLGQQKQAAEAFKQALRQNALPSDVVHQLHYNLVQVLIASTAYEEGLGYLDRWLSREPSPGVEGLKLAATVYYQAKQCKKAIPYLRQLLAQREKPEEQWQQVLLACYYESSQYLEAARLLEQIVGHDPHEKRYWRHLAAAYQQAGEDMRALAALTLAYEQGLLDSQTTMELVQMYSYLQIPYKGAQLLAAEVEAGRIKETQASLQTLANSWILAHEKEKAARVLERMGRLGGSANAYFSLGQLLFEMEHWDQAVKALDSALSAGFTKVGAARLLQGIAFYHAGERQKSIKTLELARQDEAHRGEAEWWIQRIRQENADLSG